jgi:precorrin-2 dehydrogenase/sirohydrochlorin ferrochelatase
VREDSRKDAVQARAEAWFILMKRIYPIALILEGRTCLVVGGGRIAERKIESLVQAGAKVRVVTLAATEAVQEWARQGLIELRLGAYVPEDLAGAFVVIVATDNPDLNADISAACQQQNVLVNVVDQPALCSFYVPAVVERGPVSIAISTAGAGPALAKRLRMVLEDVVGEEYGHLALLMDELRGEVIATYSRQPDRAAAWNRLLDSDVQDLLRDDQPRQARQVARQIMGLPAAGETGDA